MRFFRKGHLDIDARIHTKYRPRQGSRVVDLAPSPGRHIVHFNYESVSDFLLRMDRYTSIEASTRAEAGERPSMLRAGMIDLLNRFVRRGGWRDGWRGLYLALAMGLYRATIAAKMREHKELGDESAHTRDEREAARWLGPRG